MTRLEFAPILENVFILLLIPMNGRRMLLHWNIFVPAHCRRLFGVETSNGEAQRAVDFFSPKNSDGAEGTEWQKSQTDTFSKNLKWMEVQHSRRIFISFFFKWNFHLKSISARNSNFRSINKWIFIWKWKADSALVFVSEMRGLFEFLNKGRPMNMNFEQFIMSFRETIEQEAHE